MAERGRPSIFTEELAARICERLALGETLRAICRDDDMPNEATARLWAADPENPFSTQYARAREVGYHGWSDQIVEIADDKLGDPARDRLRIDSRKWIMSKALPKIYGDRQTHEVELSANDKLLSLIEAGLTRATR